MPHHHQLDHHHQLNREVAPEETKDPDHVSDYIHIHPRMLASSHNLPSGVQQPQATQDDDEDSATLDPQNRVSDRSRSPQDQEDSQRQGPQTQKGKKTAAEKQPSTPPKAKKHKSQDLDEDDEEPQNEPGTSSNSQPTVSVLPYSQGPAASAIPGDEDSEYSDEKSAQSQDSGRTVLYPDLYVRTNDEHWAMTPETHKYAAAAGSFCFVTTENGDQQDICNLTTMPCVQRSLYLNEFTDDIGNIKFEVPEGVDGRTRDVLE